MITKKAARVSAAAGIQETFTIRQFHFRCKASVTHIPDVNIIPVSGYKDYVFVIIIAFLFFKNQYSLPS